MSRAGEQKEKAERDKDRTFPIDAKGTLSKVVVRHMMLQHQVRYAQCVQLIFFLADQMQRHALLIAVAARVHNPCFTQWQQIVSAPDFVDKMERAVAKPDGPEAKEMTRRMLPLVAVVGRLVPYSRLERRAVRSKLLGLTLKFGLAPWFWSISPNDKDNPTAIRLSFSSKSNDAFPATVDNDFFDALRKGESHEGVPLNLTALQRLSVLNPIANAIGFRMMIDTVFRVLVGLESCRRRRTTLPVYGVDESTGVYTGRAKGVVGVPIAWQYVIENNGKWSCHIHGGVWGAITDRLLSKAAENVELFQRVADALDSQCCASLPFEVHVVHSAQKVLHVRSTRAALCDVPQQIDPSYALPPDGAPDDVTKRQLWADTKRVQLWAASSGDHSNHHETCHKLPQGRFGCRMCFAKPHGNTETRVMQLVLKKEANDVLIEKELWLCEKKGDDEKPTCPNNWSDEKGIIVIQPRSLPVVLDTETLNLVRSCRLAACVYDRWWPLLPLVFCPAGESSSPPQGRACADRGARAATLRASGATAAVALSRYFPGGSAHTGAGRRASDASGARAAPAAPNVGA